MQSIIFIIFIYYHDSEGVTSQTLLQQRRKLRISVRNIRSYILRIRGESRRPLGKSIYNLSQYKETLINIDTFFMLLSS